MRSNKNECNFYFYLVTSQLLKITMLRKANINILCNINPCFPHKGL